MGERNPPKVAGFEELTLIATGGYGSVYRAVDEHIGRVVAIKVLEGVNTTDARARDRFLRETRAMGKLSGVPNIVDIYQATFTTDGRPAIVMPLLTGGSLADVLTQRGALTPDEVITLGARIARALDTAHRRGISHRDIKPENILLDDHGEPGLADFGIAITTDTTTSTRTQMSLTPEHAPPELLAPTPGTPRPETLGDIYSLASTLYTLAAGHTPFGTETDTGAYDFIRRVVEQPAPTLTAIPPELNTALQHGLAKNPADRYPTALDFATTLEAIPHTPQPTNPAATAGVVGPNPVPNSINASPGRAVRTVTPSPNSPLAAASVASKWTAAT